MNGKCPRLLFQPNGGGQVQSFFLFRDFKMFSLKAKEKYNKPIIPAQIIFLFIPRCRAQWKHRLLGLSTCSVDPNEGVEARVQLYITLFGGMRS